MDNKFLLVTCKCEHLKNIMNRWCYDLKLLFQTYIVFKLAKFELLVFFSWNGNTDNTKGIHFISLVRFAHFDEKF